MVPPDIWPLNRLSKTFGKLYRPLSLLSDRLVGSDVYHLFDAPGSLSKMLWIWFLLNKVLYLAYISITNLFLSFIFFYLQTIVTLNTPKMSKRHCPEVYDPAQGKRPRQLIGGLDYPISEKSIGDKRDCSYTPPRHTDCSPTRDSPQRDDRHKEWLPHKPLVIPDVTCIAVHAQKRDYSPPLKSDSYTSHERGEHENQHPLARAKQLHYNQQLSVSSSEAPLSVPVPRPPSQPTMEPPKKGHTLVHMDSRIEPSKTGPASRVVVSPHDHEDNTRYNSTPSDVHQGNSPDRTYWAQRWPKSAKWLELSKYQHFF